MKKTFTFSFIMVCCIWCYGQETSEVLKDSATAISTDQQDPIIVKYYQTTGPDGKKSLDEKESEENIIEDSTGLSYYEGGDDDEEIVELEMEVEQIESESGLTYFDEDLDVDEDAQEPIHVKYYQTVEPNVEQLDTKEKSKQETAYYKSKKKEEVRTLYPRKSKKGGGYGALGVKTSEFNDNTLVMAGIRGAWVINRSIGIGIDAWGVVPTADYSMVPSAPNQNVALVGGYGGLLFEPILFSNQVIHLIFPISTGMGWLGYQSYGEDYNFSESDLIDEDVFWYVEPSAALEINIARFCRLNLGVSKRFTQDLQLVVTDSNDFREWNYFAMLKFGGF